MCVAQSIEARQSIVRGGEGALMKTVEEFWLVSSQEPDFESKKVSALRIFLKYFVRLLLWRLLENWGHTATLVLSAFQSSPNSCTTWEKLWQTPLMGCALKRSRTSQIKFFFQG
eukprot:GHVN01016382.1.p1 GENE.GHVN01016382.1~~GHVN01016382.1.p1  ORF type:complete len:114 (+),score=15.29 GHVN01016382.1:185-526(+)